MHRLTREQLDTVKAAPLAGMPNKVRLAMTLVGAKQNDVVEVTNLPQPYVSDVVRGRYNTITVENAHKFAEYFGCEIGDLFPARVAVAS